MKYANKLMVVPYVPRIENPTEKQILSLDQEMELVLNDKNKQVDEKVKMYNQVLTKYISNLKKFNMTQDNQRDYVEEVSSQIADKMFSKIKPELDSFKNRSIQKIPKVQIKEDYDSSFIEEEVKPSTSKAVTFEDEDTINQSFLGNSVLYKTAIEPDNEKNQQSSDETDEDDAVDENDEEETLDENDEVENFRNQKEKKKSKYDQQAQIIQFKNDERIFKVRTINNKAYFVPDCITDVAQENLIRTFPQGMDINKMTNLMTSGGLSMLTEASKKYSKYGADRKYYTKSINQWFLKNGIGIGQNGSSLLNRQWIFKKIFLK